MKVNVNLSVLYRYIDLAKEEREKEKERLEKESSVKLVEYFKNKLVFDITTIKLVYKIRDTEYHLRYNKEGHFALFTKSPAYHSNEKIMSLKTLGAAILELEERKREMEDLATFLKYNR